MTDFSMNSAHLTVCSCPNCQYFNADPESVLSYQLDAETGTITFADGYSFTSNAALLFSAITSSNTAVIATSAETETTYVPPSSPQSDEAQPSSEPVADETASVSQSETPVQPTETQQTAPQSQPQTQVEPQPIEEQAGTEVYDEITMQHLPMPGSEPGYLQALFGDDNAVWTDGGPGTAAFGNSATVTYTFDDVAWGNPYGWGNEAAFDASQRTSATAAMDMWSDVSGINFVAGTAGTAGLAFREYNLPAGAGVAVTWKADDDGGGPDRIGQVEVSPDDSLSDFTQGSWGWVTMMHEVGHSIGVKHPGNYNAGGGGAQGPFLIDFGLVDSRDFTVMSYNGGVYTSGGNNPTGLMIYDIAIAQYLYGVNTGFNSGNTTYTLNTNSGILARWDGGGTDTLNASAQSGAVTLDLREGEAYVTEVGNSATWNAFGANIENATGGSGSDTIYGNDLSNTLIGNAGDDTLQAGAGDDTLEGGAGNDTYRFGNNDGDNVVNDSDGSGIINIGGNAVTGTATDAGGTYELVKGSVTFTLNVSGADLVVTSSAGSVSVRLAGFISGWFGLNVPGSVGDTIDGTPGADTIRDTVSDDVINGLGGNDTIRVYTGADTVNGGAGNDRIYLYDDNARGFGDDGDDQINGNADNPYGNGGAGNDRISLPGDNSTLIGGDGNDILYGHGANANLDGGLGDDRLVSRGDGAMLNAGDGADELNGFGPNQTLDAGAGNDEITVTGGNSTVLAGDGNDTIEGGGAGVIINGEAGNDSIELTASGAIANGGDGDDLLFMVTTVSGELYGDSGADTLRGGNGNDTLDGGAGNDEITAGSGNDVVTGGTGNDDLHGHNGNDTVDGGGGDDTVRGGRNDDVMIGGAGSDIFVFDYNGGDDTITDFTVGDDMLQYAIRSLTETYMLNNATDVGANVQFDVYGTTLILQGVNIADLDGQEFII